MLDNSLYFQTWAPKTNAKAVVLIVHGLGEHCHRYEALAAHLNDTNIAVCSMDLPCHGKSEGPRGHIDSFDDYQDATLKLVDKTKKEFSDCPLFIIGHSMGGLIVSRLLLNHQHLFAGALLSGAAIESPQEPPKWQQSLIKGIAKIFPKAKMIALDASKVSRDPKVVEDYFADPLVSKEKLSAQFLASMMDAMTEVKDNAAKIDLPILIMHGTEDVMTKPDGSEFLHATINSTDKTLKLYQGLYHEIFNEPERDAIYAEMTDWIEARLK